MDLVKWKGLGNVRTYGTPIHSSYAPATFTQASKANFPITRRPFPLGQRFFATSKHLPSHVFAFSKGRLETTLLPQDSIDESVQRHSIRIDTLSRPGGSSSSSSSSAAAAHSLITVCLPQDPTNKYQTAQCSYTSDHKDNSWITSIAQNARRRCRSAGMHKDRSYDPNNRPNYYRDTREYLDGRSKSIQQNEYTHVRRTSPSLLGDQPSNIYSSHGLCNCPKAYISSSNANHNYIQYLWPADGFYNANGLVTHEMVIPEGYYNIEDLNAAIHDCLEANGHYVIEKASNSIIHFIHVIYNTSNNKIELQLYPMSTLLFPSSHYKLPTKDPAFVQLPSTNQIPVMVFPPSRLSNQMGFEQNSTQPSITRTTYLAQVSRNAPVATLSTRPFVFFPLYNVVNYKTNNASFKTQGAVMASAEVARAKYLATINQSNSHLWMDGDTPYNIKSTMQKPWKNAPFTWNRRKTLFNG